MKHRKEITVYSCGDSRSLATWSNVPYLFCKTLEQAGYVLNRVNIEPNPILQKYFNKVSFALFCRLAGRQVCPIYSRTALHRYLTRRKLKKAIKDYPDSELNLFLSYAFINPYSSVPNVLWCDWTDRVVIERQGRMPAKYEQASLQSEDEALRAADALYTMFPKCKEHMENIYGLKFDYLDRNVINTVYEGDVDNDKVLKKRFESQRILFIGGMRYKYAAVELIEAYTRLKTVFPELRLDIIGMTTDQLGLNKSVSSGIECYGYLNKDVLSQREKYYELLLQAKVLVNTAAQWGGYSSTTEAMYYACPVIVAPYEDFVENFGKDIQFGLYHKPGKLDHELIELLNLNQVQYRNMAMAARDKVKDYTWSNYIDVFLKDLQSKNLISSAPK